MRRGPPLRDAARQVCGRPGTSLQVLLAAKPQWTEVSGRGWRGCGRLGGSGGPIGRAERAVAQRTPSPRGESLRVRAPFLATG